MLEFLGVCLAWVLLIALIISVFILFMVGYMLYQEEKAHGKNLSRRLP